MQNVLSWLLSDERFAVVLASLDFTASSWKTKVRESEATWKDTKAEAPSPKAEVSNQFSPNKKPNVIRNSFL